MALSDAFLANLTTFYVAVVLAINAYSLVSGRNFGAGVRFIVSIIVVVAVLVLMIAWDISRKAAEAFKQLDRNSSKRQHKDGGGSSCKGGICWHGLAVRSKASQVRFRLPQDIYPTLLSESM